MHSPLWDPPGAPSPNLSFYEFFAGGGMARLGLGAAWRCLRANDADSVKCAAYRANFGGEELIEADIATIGAADFPDQADLAWASFPCQDLSLAGSRGGLSAPRSGTFFQFWRIIRALQSERRAPRCLVLENVTGLLSSNGGADFSALASHLAKGGYRLTGFVLDAAQFTPQSRKRLFVVAFDRSISLPGSRVAPEGTDPALLRAVEALDQYSRSAWNWAALPVPPRRNRALIDELEPREGVDWAPAEKTEQLLNLMSPRHAAMLDAEKQKETPRVGTLFKRIRIENGASRQRAEVRFDGMAGCLRTPRGGSSRQTLLYVNGDDVRSRLLTPRECARLMGLPDNYRLPAPKTAALKLTGDGVAVPVVRWLSEHLLEPALSARKPNSLMAATG